MFTYAEQFSQRFPQKAYRNLPSSFLPIFCLLLHDNYIHDLHRRAVENCENYQKSRKSFFFYFFWHHFNNNLIAWMLDKFGCGT